VDSRQKSEPTFEGSARRIRGVSQGIASYSSISTLTCGLMLKRDTTIAGSSSGMTNFVNRHPEVRAQASLEGCGLGAQAVALRGSLLRDEHLRVTGFDSCFDSYLRSAGEGHVRYGGRKTLSPGFRFAQSGLRLTAPTSRYARSLRAIADLPGRKGCRDPWPWPASEAYRRARNRRAACRRSPRR